MGMTPFYIAEFKKENKCSSCPAKKQSRRKMCAYHLRVAREAFMAWSTERKAMGKCAYCHRKSFKGWLRCRTHAAANRENCRKWSLANPEWSAIQWKKRLGAYGKNGLCMYCKEHRPAVPGNLKCQPCRDARTTLAKGLRKAWEGTAQPQRGA